MANVAQAGIVAVLVFFLTPGMIISVPPGPNKLWVRGGQVTTMNALIHAALVGFIVYLFVQ